MAATGWIFRGAIGFVNILTAARATRPFLQAIRQVAHKRIVSERPFSIAIAIQFHYERSSCLVRCPGSEIGKGFRCSGRKKFATG
jgi:hypothetical protein